MTFVIYTMKIIKFLWGLYYYVDYTTLYFYKKDIDKVCEELM